MFLTLSCLPSPISMQALYVGLLGTFTLSTRHTIVCAVYNIFVDIIGDFVLRDFDYGVLLGSDFYLLGQKRTNIGNNNCRQTTQKKGAYENWQFHNIITGFSNCLYRLMKHACVDSQGTPPAEVPPHPSLTQPIVPRSW